jgi:tetratricopeptide (TPR) repeat protein
VVVFNYIQIGLGYFITLIMLKPFAKLLLGILILLSNSTFAQNQNDASLKTEYATLVTKSIPALYYQQNWPKIVEYAQKAMLADSNVYIQNVQWEQIGEARFKLSDYRGAIKDFNRFIAKEIKKNVHNTSITNWVKINKVNAHFALGEKEEAAKTHLYFAKNNMAAAPNSVQQAAILYKQLGNETRYRHLIDSSVVNYQLIIDENIKRNMLMQPLFMVDYAEVLLMADKPAMAIEILNKPTAKNYSKEETAIKSYLLSTAQYLVNPLLFDQIKNKLINDIAINGKITNWYFGMFDSWITLSALTPTQKGQLFAIQQIAQ